MKILLRLAWRNVWRNKVRTVILICAMTAGLVGVLFSLGLTNSWLDQIRENAVRTFAGHIKIHHAGYFDRPIVTHAYSAPDSLASTLSAHPAVRAWAPRSSVQGLLSTASRSRIVTLVGIDAEREKQVSVIADAMQEGGYLDEWKKPGRPILISRKLSERIGMGVGKKVVLMSQQFGSNEVGSGAFRIAGVFDTGNVSFDENHVYLQQADVQQMLQLGDRVTETVLMLHEMEESEEVALELSSAYEGEGLAVLSWKERMPFVDKSMELTRRMMVPYYSVFYIAMAFGIVNTLLMAIGERTHEIGVMMAVGMGRKWLIFLILLESMMIAAVASVLGCAVGGGLVAWIGATGIDLSAMAEGLAYMGVSRVIYPRLGWEEMTVAGAAALAVAAAFSLYPAWRAARMEPVVAIRSVG